MSSDIAEPWRKTGRKAPEEHLFGVGKGVLLEIGLYHDDGSKQGQAIVQILDGGEDSPEGKGKTHTARFHAVEDGYYEWWLTNEFGDRPVPMHFCRVPASRCGEATVFRNPIHVDVFRVLPGRSALKISWLKDEAKERLKDVVESLLASTPTHATPGVPGVGSRGAGGSGGMEVETGAAGIAGLAQALGKKDDGETPSGEKPQEPQKKKQKVSARKKDPNEELEEALKKRKSEDAGRNVLRLGREAGGGKSKKKKKKKKSKKGEKAEKSTSDSESDSTSSSSLFRLAALPNGVDRLHRLHEERPGAIANSTLRRFNVLLNQSVGRGAAEVTENLPPVARGYMSQIFLGKHPEGTIGMRNLREMRTLTTKNKSSKDFNYTKMAMDLCHGGPVQHYARHVGKFVQLYGGKASKLEQPMQFKMFGKACIRFALHLTSKEKMGTEGKTRSMEELKTLMESDLATAGVGSSAASAASSTTAKPPAEQEVPYDLDQANNPMFLAKQLLDLDVGKNYTVKDQPGRIWALTEIGETHIVLKHYPLLEPTKICTMKFEATEITCNIKPTKQKMPKLFSDEQLQHLWASSTLYYIIPMKHPKWNDETGEYEGSLSPFWVCKEIEEGQLEYKWVTFSHKLGDIEIKILTNKDMVAAHSELGMRSMAVSEAAPSKKARKA
ncbi:unnamed protein product [Durusdinium trenchii]|uniref:Uncharacterized protein n=1 Tax=Durusdinium trenchii TaxID=1381693 RepID=A0ABP0L3H0_9DINO